MCHPGITRRAQRAEVPRDDTKFLALALTLSLNL